MLIPRVDLERGTRIHRLSQLVIYCVDICISTEGHSSLYKFKTQVKKIIPSGHMS